MEHEELTQSIISCAFKVHNTLGSGFLERVYENVLFIELTKRGLLVKQPAPIRVRYDGHVVGEYVADLIVADTVIVESKAVLDLAVQHEMELENYLTGTGIDTGLLPNFGPSVKIKRKFPKYLTN